ncbi:MAG: DUF1819 family protein [Anaerolineaceae bacterium]|nr:DUF1819 family protein [Anaerolineaceae bacterium]
MTERYKLSFTAVSLGLAESVIVAEVYLQLQDWGTTKEKVKSENLLQSRVQSSIQRVYQEIEPRLQTLSIEQLRFLVEEANIIEQKQILWYTLCKRYQFIRDFANEVLFQRFKLFHTQLDEFDYTVFYNNKADWHQELRDIKQSTQTKIRTVLFRMMREADFLSNDNRILPCTLSQAVINQLAVDAPWSYAIFPTTPPTGTGGINVS